MSYQLTMHEAFDCPRAPQDVFQYIVDFSRITEWDHTILSAVKTTSGKIAVGTAFDLKYSMGLRKVPIRYEVMEFEPPQRAVLKGVSRGFTAIDTVTITETSNGCHVDWRAELEFRGASAKIVPLIERRITAAGVQTIKDLAKALRDDAPTPKLSPLQRVADKLIVPGVLGFSRFGHQHAEKHWQPVTASMRDKHVVLTGATSGLGLATAHELAQRGAKLTLIARDAVKADRVAKEITAQTGNEQIEVRIADLSEIAQVVELGKTLLKKGEPIDVLINNAGALFNPRRETSERIEASFALLLLSPFVLTEQLFPLLKQASSSRVINVSSGGMYGTKINLKNLESERGQYRGADAYARAKRGLVIMGERWAERWADEGIKVHNMHPGWAQTPGVEESLPQFAKLTRRILRSPEEGADTIVWLANATEANNTSGLFWLDRAPHTTHLSRRTVEKPSERDALEDLLREYRSRLI